jgi:hypothetical protein
VGFKGASEYDSKKKELTLAVQAAQSIEGIEVKATKDPGLNWTFYARRHGGSATRGGILVEEGP